MSAFHNAQALVVLFGDKNFYFSVPDAYIMAQNIALSAYAYGVSTCIVGEVLNSFVTEKGKDYLLDIQMPDHYVPCTYITMGYCEGEYPKYPKRNYKDIIYK